MKIIELNLTGCKYLSDIHKKIKEAFNFPVWYGENWSAFCDFLCSECDADKVIIKGENSLPDELKEELSVIHDIFKEKISFNKKCNFNEFSYEILM